MVGKLRRKLVTTESETERLEAAYGLGRLAIENVPGADPAQWAGILKFDTPEALVPLTDDESGKVWVFPSQLDNFIKCPLHWFMQAHGGTDKSFEANFGTLLHKVLEETKSTDYDTLWENVRSKWNTLEFEANWVEKQEIRKAQKMVRNLSNYLEERQSEGYELVGVEVPLDVQIGSARVVGRVDRIEKDPEGKLVIVDLKTGKTAPKAEENAQLGLYQLAYLNNGFDAEITADAQLAGAALLLVGGTGKKLTEQKSLVDSPELHEHFMALLEDAVEGMSGSEFNAHLGTHCDDQNSYGNCRLLLTKAVSYVD
jgi:RecB family exonuclease